MKKRALGSGILKSRFPGSAAWEGAHGRKTSWAASSKPMTHIAPFREDGVTYRNPMRIPCVTVGDALYLCGYNGQSSRRYQ